jgi:hypothetical protein
MEAIDSVTYTKLVVASDKRERPLFLDPFILPALQSVHQSPALNLNTIIRRHPFGFRNGAILSLVMQPRRAVSESFGRLLKGKAGTSASKCVSE